jgi:hypothetical protein
MMGRFRLRLGNFSRSDTFLLARTSGSSISLIANYQSETVVEEKMRKPYIYGDLVSPF